MGFFSFITQNTNKSIANTASHKETIPVAMIDNKGNYWIEPYYGGYGKFGGKDFFELMAEMNGKEGRDAGINLYYSGDTSLNYPNLIEIGTKDELENWKYINEAPEDCEFQGYFY